MHTASRPCSLPKTDEPGKVPDDKKTAGWYIISWGMPRCRGEAAPRLYEPETEGFSLEARTFGLPPVQAKHARFQGKTRSRSSFQAHGRKHSNTAYGFQCGRQPFQNGIQDRRIMFLGVDRWEGRYGRWFGPEADWRL